MCVVVLSCSLVISASEAHDDVDAPGTLSSSRFRPGAVTRHWFEGLLSHRLRALDESGGFVGKAKVALARCLGLQEILLLRLELLLQVLSSRSDLLIDSMVGAHGIEGCKQLLIPEKRKTYFC